jgi:hypothetical protein
MAVVSLVVFAGFAVYGSLLFRFLRKGEVRVASRIARLLPLVNLLRDFERAGRQ